MKTMDSKFAGTCRECRTGFPAGTRIVWEAGAGAKHADTGLCAARKLAVASAPKPVTVTVNLKSIADFIGAAKARGLKFPKARFLAPGGGDLRLNISGETSRVPGSIQVVVRDEWVGRVHPDGEVYGQALSGNTQLLDALRVIAADPAAAAKAYGALMCVCSFCGTGLTDEGSVEVGYGPVCAKNWGLPHQPKGTRQLTKVEVVAAMEQRFDNVAASLSDGDEIPVARRAALTAELSAALAQGAHV